MKVFLFVVATDCAVALVANSSTTTCECKSCFDGNPCAPPFCQVCGPNMCGGTTQGCETSTTSSCQCAAPTWPTGEGCTDDNTEYVHYDSGDLAGCCQMPKQWMTEPHDEGGVKVPPMPFPFTTSSWGSACGIDEEWIPRSATFTDGTCKSVGSDQQNGGCINADNCRCSTMWIPSSHTVV